MSSSSDPAVSPRLLLVHGLWRTPLSFLTLMRRLRGWGYRTQPFGYAAMGERYDAIVGRLVNALERLAATGPYGVIGHSLGGVLLRSALPRITGPAPAHLVMLGTPNQPPRLAGRLGTYRAYRHLMGECGVNLASPAFYAGLPVPEIPCTIIAGTAGPQGRWSPFGGEPNDRVVAVSETHLRDGDPVVRLPVGHTFMMNHAGVQAVIRRALSGSVSTP